MAEAIFFDGQTALKRRVGVRIGAATLDLEADAGVVRWPLPSLRELESLAGELKLRSLDAPELAHVIIDDPGTIAALRAAIPALPPEANRLETPRWKIVAVSLGAAASILGLIAFGIPLLADRLAVLVPPALERRLGDSVAREVKQMFDAEVCTSPAGTRALQKLSAALAGDVERRNPIRIDVLRTPVFNAIALPGGQVFLFDGLLQKAQGVDEVAGVLGHEIGHEHNRDLMRGVIRSGGTAFLLGLLFGDVAGSWAVLFISRQLIDSAHSREDEHRADDHGRVLMHGLGRPAADMAKLLVRLSGDEPGRGSIFSSHPLSRERLERLGRADTALARPLDGAPILTAGEWQALRRICDND